VRRAAGTEVLVADALAALPWLVHGFSTRIGGASKLGATGASNLRPLNLPSLNLGFTEWDRREVVARNRAQFLCAAGAGKMTLATMRQIHSDVVQVFAAPPAVAESQPPKADAAVTRQGICCSRCRPRTVCRSCS